MITKIPLQVARRPVTSDDTEYYLDDMENHIRNEIEARMGETKPPYLNMYATENYIWLHTDSGEAGKQMVVLNYEGNALGKFLLPEIDTIEQIKGNTIYTIHRSPEQGDMIRAYRVQL